MFRSGPCLRRRAGIACAMAVLGMVVACGPSMTVTRAEQVCEDQVAASLAGPSATLGGSVGVGVGSEGPISDVDLGVVLTRPIPPRDPRAAFDRCVRRNSGQGPTRPIRL